MTTPRTYCLHRAQRQRRALVARIASHVGYVALGIGTLPLGYCCAFMGAVVGAGVNPSDGDYMAFAWCAVVAMPCLVIYLVAGLVLVCNQD